MRLLPRKAKEAPLRHPTVVTSHVLTSDICGKRLMAKGRARPKAARHTRLWTGRIIRGRDLRSDVLQRKGFVRPFNRPEEYMPLSKSTLVLMVFPSLTV